MDAETGRKFYWDNSFSLTTAMLLGLSATFALPSVLRVLVATRRSGSQYTAYRRYLATLLHVVTWLEGELKPGSVGRKFYWDNSFSLTTAMLLGLSATFALPSVLRVLVATRRSGSQYTAYRRYLATLLHVVTWLEGELKPGSVSWRSLHKARTSHFRAGLATRLKGHGVVSQRDLALTLVGIVGLPALRPDTLGVVATRAGDWEAFVHLWRVLAHMVGIEERYNLCRNLADARAASRVLLARVLTPSLDAVPEPFYHMTDAMIRGVQLVIPTVSPGAVVYLLRGLCDVPGYVCTEGERMRLQDTLRRHLNGRPEDTGIDSRELMSPPGIEGVPTTSRLLYVRDYDVLGAAPEYRTLSLYEKYKLATLLLLLHLNTYRIMRTFLNIYLHFSLFLMRNFPVMAFLKYGREAFVNTSAESPTDDTRPLTNSEYQKERKATWFRDWWSIFLHKVNRIIVNLKSLKI